MKKLRYSESQIKNILKQGEAGVPVPENHKRVYRICRELELNLRIRPRKRLKRDKLDALAVPETINECGRWTLCMINLGTYLQLTMKEYF